jgi:hypothetical protein
MIWRASLKNLGQDSTRSASTRTQLRAEGFGDSLHFREREAPPTLEHAHHAGLGHGLQQKLQALRVQLGGKHVDAGHVATGTGEAGDDSRLDQAARPPKRHDDRDRIRRLPRRENCRRTDGDDDIHFGMDELGGKSWKTIKIIFGGTGFERDRLPLDVAQGAQCLAERSA